MIVEVDTIYSYGSHKHIVYEKNEKEGVGHFYKIKEIPESWKEIKKEGKSKKSLLEKIKSKFNNKSS